MIISSYFSTASRASVSETLQADAKLKVGQIEKILYADHEDNLSEGKYVEYIVSIIDDKGSVVKRRARQASSLFSTNDYEELILEANEFAFDGKQLSAATTSEFKNGTQVLVLFLNEKITNPIIIGALSHNRISENDSLMLHKPASTEDGIRHSKEFRGLQQEITKDGEYSVTYLGDRNHDGTFKREDTHPTIIKIDKTGKLSFYDKEKQQIHLDRASKKIEIKQVEGTISNSSGEFSDPADGTIVNSIEMDKAAKKITYTSKDLTVEQDGNGDKYTISTASGVSAEINGTTIRIKMDTPMAYIEIDGITGKIKLSGNFVDLGAAVSDFVVLFNRLAAMYNTHTHISTLPGQPTSPTAPLLTSVGSLTVKAQS